MSTGNEMGRIDKNSAIGALNFRANAVFIRYTRRVWATGMRFQIAYTFVNDADTYYGSGFVDDVDSESDFVFDTDA